MAQQAVLKVTNGHPGGYSSAGKYFGFENADADSFFGSTSWSGQTFDVTANGKSAKIKVWKDSENCKMSCGRWDDGIVTAKL